MKEVLEHVVVTGISEIDKKMGGGIPHGSLGLIEGDSDSGKSVLVQQICYGTLNAGQPVCLYTTENTSRSLLRQMDSIGIDVSDYFIMGRFESYTLPVGSDEPVLEKVLDHIRRSKAELVVVDSITPFVASGGEEAVMRFFTAAKKECDRAGKTVLVVVHANSLDEGVMVRLRSMCDAHVRTRLEGMGDKLVKMMEVAKVRGASKSTGNVLGFNVEPGLGMRIIPVSKAKA